MLNIRKYRHKKKRLENNEKDLLQMFSTILDCTYGKTLSSHELLAIMKTGNDWLIGSWVLLPHFPEQPIVTCDRFAITDNGQSWSIAF